MDVLLNRRQARRVDELAIEHFGMTGLVLMENAGRGAADVLCELGIRGPVIVCCGRGNNGGDGFVVARHLDLRGHPVRVLLCCPSKSLSGDAAANYAILQKANIPVMEMPHAVEPDRFGHLVADADWILDALLGTGARGNPRPPLNDAIDSLNAVTARRMAIDLPSGLDCDTGIPGTPTIRADVTCTFVAAKQGFGVPSARPYLGHVRVLDIGTPPQLLESVLTERTP